MKKNIFVITVSALALSACATKPLPPAINYDSDDFKPAVVDREPAKPVEIVEVPKVLPSPGQLQPEPGEVAEDKRPPTQRVGGRQQSGDAGADAIRLRQRHPGLSLCGRGALSPLCGARAGERHRLAARREAHLRFRR